MTYRAATTGAVAGMERTRAWARRFGQAFVGARRSSGRAPLELAATRIAAFARGRSRQLSGYTRFRASDDHALRRSVQCLTIRLRNDWRTEAARIAQAMSRRAAPSP